MTPSPPLEALRRARPYVSGQYNGLTNPEAREVLDMIDAATVALAHPAESAETVVKESLTTGSAEAGAVPAERTALIAAHNAIEGLLAWDAKRNFPVPYRVRDPLREVLGAARSTLAAKNGLALAEKQKGAK